MKKTFKEWFFTLGWKKYLIPLLIGTIIETAVILSWIYLPEDFMDDPQIIVAAITLIPIAFLFGMIYHMLDAFKIYNEEV